MDNFISHVATFAVGVIVGIITGWRGAMKKVVEHINKIKGE